MAMFNSYVSLPEIYQTFGAKMSPPPVKNMGRLPIYFVWLTGLKSTKA